MFWLLLDVEVVIGVVLIESYVMWLVVLVSGFYIGYLDSYYFGVGKVEKDQVVDYVECKVMMVEEVERWFLLILNYML